MKSIKLMGAAVVLALGFSAPGHAQMQDDAMHKDAMHKDGTMSSGSMKMSMADKKKMASCQKMTHDMMMKNAGCMKMMKMHPDMMKGG